MPNAVLHLIVTASSAAIPMGILEVGCHFLAPESLWPHLLTLLVAWTTLSVPAGMLIGHCMLDED